MSSTVISACAWRSSRGSRGIETGVRATYSALPNRAAGARSGAQLKSRSESPCTASTWHERCLVLT